MRLASPPPAVSTAWTGRNARLARLSITRRQQEPQRRREAGRQIFRIEYLWRKYDRADNGVESRQYASTNGAITLWATNAWGFDGLHRTISQVVRDGATNTFGWDAAGDLTNRVVPGGLIWKASY